MLGNTVRHHVNHIIHPQFQELEDVKQIKKWTQLDSNQ